MKHCNTIRVFVYGTLMQHQRAHHFLKDCAFLGRWLLRDYAMYDLGNFPGIQKKEGKCVVGEVYALPKHRLPELDHYEGEGDLYHRRTVTVTKGVEQMEVQTYIYAQQVDSDTPMERPWGSSDSDLVWYAGYGSNLEYERFLCYIRGGKCKWNGEDYSACKEDPSLPRECCVRSYPGRLYFANASGRWHGSSVAFFDPAPAEPDDRVWMRLYKISRQQLEHVHRQEGKGSDWYPNLLCLDIHEDGAPIYTVTAAAPKPPTVPPADPYRNCILCGLGQIGLDREKSEHYYNKWL